MNEDEYFQKRLEDQITWYDRKSQINQRYYKFFKFIEISLAAMIPFLAGIGDILPYHSIVIGFIGAVVSISLGISAVWKFHENWIKYRTTCESLKHEKYLYRAKCHPYDENDPLNKLVQRVEAIISEENSQWVKNSRTSNSITKN